MFGCFLSVILSERSESKDPYSRMNHGVAALGQRQIWDAWRPKGPLDSKWAV
jgi:hypothetical protein